MSAHVFTAGTPAERRAWVGALAAGMREEAGSKYEVAGTLERAARDLDSCDAEAGTIPVAALNLALFECIDDATVGCILGMPEDHPMLADTLRHLLKADA